MSLELTRPNVSFEPMDPSVLIRTLDAYQMACLAMEGVFSTKILEDKSLITNLLLRTESNWPVLMDFGCTHAGRYLEWVERLKIMEPLVYFMLSHSGCLAPAFTATPGSELAKWVLATNPPRYVHQPSLWKKHFKTLLDDILAAYCDDSELEDLSSEDSDTEVDSPAEDMSGSE
ncbi:uncharacterized protein BKA78DRAFT_356182 [Phyllosticta capitalensis]|uniref:uncharacterized protein n=1 Tax=Phyllosticta capitalensis TaxID=121624 RepID=UPI0031302419